MSYKNVEEMDQDETLAYVDFLEDTLREWLDTIWKIRGLNIPTENIVAYLEDDIPLTCGPYSDHTCQCVGCRTISIVD